MRIRSYPGSWLLEGRLARWTATRAWPWAVLSVVLPAAALFLHVQLEKDGDISGIYYVTEPFYQTTALHEAYGEQEIQFQSGPYDPIFFLANANDPLLRYGRGDAQKAPSLYYRGRRILFSWAGWLLGAGQPRAIFYSLPAANILLLAACVLSLATFLIENGRHPGWSLFYTGSLGAAVCLLRPLGDLFATSLLLLACFAWHRKRLALAALGFTLAALTKEATLLAPFGIGIYCVARGQWREAAWLAVVPLGPLAWWAYVAAAHGPHVGVGIENLGVPLAGLAERLARLPELHGRADWVALASVLASMLGVVLARPADWNPFRMAAAGFVALALVSTMQVWIEHWSYGRIFMPIPGLLLLCYALQGRRLDLGCAVLAAVAGCFLWLRYI